MKEAWHKFCHWQGWAACVRGWNAFLGWHGWGDLAHWRGWGAFARWKGWHLHPVLILILCLIAGLGLVWVFAGGREDSWPAYLIYAVSAYAVTVLAAGIPGIIRWVKDTVLTHRLIRPLVESREKRFLLSLLREQIVNFCYGIFKTVFGILLGTVWVWADGLYNLVQGITQLGQIALHRKKLPVRQQWKSYRVCGWMILLGHLTMTGLVFLMIHRDMAEEYPGYMIFATAAFAFYKIIHAFVKVAKDRKHVSPVDSSVYLLDLTQAMFSMFSLQVAMLHAFDDGGVDARLLNSMSGGAVCLLVMATGVYMIRRANRELKKIQGEEDGRVL